MTRDPASLDPVRLRGDARDVFTAADGTLRVHARASLHAVVEMIADRVAHVETLPEHPELNTLVGGPARSGFRSAADQAVPTLRARRDPLYTLLDDVPVTVLISGHALSASGLLGSTSQAGYLPLANQCAGFVGGGLLMNSFEAGEITTPTGPLAPALANDDPEGWHPLQQLPVHGMRRRRRIDVWHDFQGGPAHDTLVDAMFRDTYVRGDGSETVIHEYTLTARIAADGMVLDADAVPRVLPWQECPGAVDSAGRIVGMTVSELHRRVRNELEGTSTCTHLNDLLRSLGDATSLSQQLT